MYQRIVVPLDGSDLAELALLEATEMATLTGAPVHLVRVVEFPDTGQHLLDSAMFDTGTLLDDDLAIARQYLTAVAAQLDVPGGVTQDVRVGSVAQLLVDVSQIGDLLVMASHGRTGISRWFMGSVAEEVMRRSKVSVLLVRAPTIHVADHSMASQARLQPTA